MATQPETTFPSTSCTQARPCDMLSPMAYKQNIPGQVMPFFSLCVEDPKGFSGGSSVKNPPAAGSTQETWVLSLGQEEPLEKEMATHSSIFAQKIPWMQEPGRLQSMGLQRVGHELVTKQQWKIPKPYTIVELQARRKLGPESHLSNRSTHSGLFCE